MGSSDQVQPPISHLHLLSCTSLINATIFGLTSTSEDGIVLCREPPGSGGGQTPAPASWQCPLPARGGHCWPWGVLLGGGAAGFSHTLALRFWTQSSLEIIFEAVGLGHWDSRAREG